MTHPSPQQQDGELRRELEKLFKQYSVGVSSGMNALYPKTVDDAEKHLHACIDLAMALFTQALEQQQAKVLRGEKANEENEYEYLVWYEPSSFSKSI